MKFDRRTLVVALALACTAGLGCPHAAHAQADYPTRPIRMVIGVPPGGTTDILGRLVGAPLGERLGRSIVIDNRPGASGIIAVGLVVKSQPDGHTLSLAGSSITAIGSLYANVPFDVSRDLVPVAFIAGTPFALVVHPSLAVQNLQELLTQSKARPEGFNYGGSTPGTVQHLSGELLKRMTGARLTYVPYKGTGAVLPDLLAGRLQAAIENVVTMRPHIRSGAVRGIAVTGPTRSSVLPELPTVAEAGVPGFQTLGRFAVFAPARTPRAIVERLNREIGAVVEAPEVKQRLIAQGAEPAGGAPEAIRAEVQREIDQWSKVIREAGLRFE